MIFGSQAILGEFPNAPKELRTSIEVDVQSKNRVDKVDDINGSLGEMSPFYYAHGFYVHGLLIEEAAILPKGWESRAKPVFDKISTNGNIGWCVESHDLAASKLAAFRPKDRDFVRLLLIEKMINIQILFERIDLLVIDEQLRDRLVQWVQYTVEEL